jgi:transposase-like protein
MSTHLTVEEQLKEQGTPPPNGGGRQGVHPDPEVVERPTRRKFTAEYKRRVLADVAADPRAVGLILRREGLYSSHLTNWRKAREKAERNALEPKKRGPKPVAKDPYLIEKTTLKRENAQLQKKLRKAEVIIDLQKKVSQILGITLPALEESDDESEVSK